MERRAIKLECPELSTSKSVLSFVSASFFGDADTALRQFHCNTQSTDRIALIRETSICNYVLIIHTPRLCTISLFLDSHAESQGESNTIECRPVVNKIKSTPSPPTETPASQLVLGSLEEENVAPVVDAKVEPDFEIRFADFMKQPLEMDEGEMLTLVYNAETGEVESLAREDAATIDEVDEVKPTTAGLETLAKLVSLTVRLIRCRRD